MQSRPPILSKIHFLLSCVSDLTLHDDMYRTTRLTAGSSEAAQTARRTIGPHRRTGTPTSSSGKCRRSSGRCRSTPPRRRLPASTGRGARSLTVPPTAPPSCRTSAPRITLSATASRPTSQSPQSAGGNASGEGETNLGEYPY